MVPVLLAVIITKAMAQQTTDDDLAKAEHAFTLLLADETDSLMAMMSPEMVQALSAQNMHGAMAQVESSLGAYQEHSPWERRMMGDTEACVSTVSFEHGQLMAVIVFDGDKMTGLRMMPAVHETTPGFYTLPHDAIETYDTVRTAPGIALPATVTLSGRSAQPPIVVMVHGSGPLDRDETVMANKTFLDLACQLAERGISTLRYDKRTLVYPQAPVNNMDDEVISDALSAIRLAHGYSNNVYLLGHSLGAMMAPAIALHAGSLLSGIIMMAGPARDLEQVVSEQLDYLLPPDTPDSLRAMTFNQLRTMSPHYLQPQGQVKAAKQLSLPMLILQGGRDYQVTMTDYNLWQEATEGRDGVVTRSYPSLNHLFLEGEGPSTPLEYQRQSHIPQQVIDDIATFVSESRKQ